MELERLGPAKVNLFLHVGPLGEDGYHPICSLMAFADVGDRLVYEDAAELEFRVIGDFAQSLSSGPDNLVLRARDAALEMFGVFDRPFRLTLEKRLPIAAGLGGGSSDAAATLLLLAQALNFSWRRGDDEPLWQIACSLGSDVGACLFAEPLLARGRGDELDRPPVFPDLDVVLVNPGVASHTGAVYAAYDAEFVRDANAPAYPEPMKTTEAVARFLAACRNDLEAPAIRLQPRIGEALGVLRGQPEALLARMSGSGATSFALCKDGEAARQLAGRLGQAHPDWWVRACRLKGFHP